MAGRRLIALDAKTGAAASPSDKTERLILECRTTPVPGIFRNVIVVGANTPPGERRHWQCPRVRCTHGRQAVGVQPVPQPGAVGHDTWDGDSWKGRLGVNAWPFYFTFDESRGLVYLPLASPIPGAFGGDRKGANPSETRSWRSMFRLDSINGTSRRSITICGITIHQRRPDCSTSCRTDAGFLRLDSQRSRATSTS